MDMRVLNLTAAVALAIGWAMLIQSSAAPAATGDAAPFVAASMVGRWLYDPRGQTIGSVRGLADGGRTAVIMVGSYFRPGSHEARVPAGALSIVDGRVTLRAEMTEVSNTPAGRAAEVKPGPDPAQPEVRRSWRLLSPFATEVDAWPPPREVGR